MNVYIVNYALDFEETYEAETEAEARSKALAAIQRHIAALTSDDPAIEVFMDETD